MKIVLDTNVLIAAFIAHGSCNELIEHCAVHHDITLSKPMLDEFSDVLVRKFGYNVAEAKAAATLIQSRAFMVKPVRLPGAVCRDPDDDVVLATALAGCAQVIVTGDKDLTVLKSYEGIKIIRPADFWQYEQELAEPAF
ncbi:MAG: putative toxin-antitoxin system toxin component, PIN family [bacterium]